jgi:hypothetical protein
VPTSDKPGGLPRCHTAMVPAIQLTAGAQEEFYTPAPTSAPAGGIHDQLAVQLAGIAEGSLCTVAGSAVAKVGECGDAQLWSGS